MKDQPPISELLKNLRDETSQLVRQEIQLAKTEASEKAATLLRNMVAFLVGALVAYSALHFLLLAIASILAHLFWEMDIALTVSFFLGSLIVAVVVGIVSAVLVGKAKKSLEDFSITPERTVDSLKSDKQFVERKFSHDTP